MDDDGSKFEKVSIILPAYNEEDAIADVIERTQETTEKLDAEYEILVVDDASTDNTAQIAENKGVRVIRRKRNGGSGAARKTGILAADGDVIVMLDVDGSYEPANIPLLLKAMTKHEMVNGVREKEQGTLKFLRYPAKLVIRKLAEFLSGTKIPDLNTGIKAFRKEIMLKYMWVVPDGFSCVTSMTLAFLTNGYSVGYVPVNYYKRIGKSKFHPLKDTAKYIHAVLRMILFFSPMRFFLPLSLAVMTVGVTKGIYDRFYLADQLLAADIVILVSSVVLLLIGLVCDLIVAQTKQMAYFHDIIQKRLQINKAGQD